MTPYTDIFNKFNIACQFYDLDTMVTAKAEDFLIKLMDDAIINFRSTKVNLTDRDDTSKTFTNDLSPIVKKIIAEYMIYGWTERYVNDQDMLKQFLSTNAFKMFSPANQLKELRAVNNRAFSKAQNLETQYSIANNIGNLG
jgi:hypothetical protein